LIFNNNDKLTLKIKLLPAFNDDQLYGQCTWYAWHVMRIRNQQQEITSYYDSKIVAMQETPSKVNIPRSNSIIMNRSLKHTAYITSVSQSEPITNPVDKSTTVIYTINGMHANWNSRTSVDPFKETTMSVTTSKDGKTRTMIKPYPIAGYQMTHVCY